MIATEPYRWIRKTGRLSSVADRIRATVPASVGELVSIQTESTSAVTAEVIGFEDDSVQLMPLQNVSGFRRGALVTAQGSRMRIPVGHNLMGRVIDMQGHPIDGKGPVHCRESVSVQMQAPDPLQRVSIEYPFETGQRAIDGLLTLGQGQRVGLFAGSGVGKSTLLGDIARYAQSEINVVALIGERGREVRPFVEDSLGEEGLARSVVIVATSDEPPLARIRAAESAVAIASWFRSQGKNVMFMLDSITRFSHACRELGLLLGEPPASRGYTPSVFQRMAQLLEQLGNSADGSITSILTVLVDGDDMNDPVADAARSILDGHIVLDRKLAHQGHFPAINILASASRLFNEITTPEHAENAMRIKRVLAKYAEIEDLIQIGAYQRGAVAESDQAIDAYPAVCQFLRQAICNPTTFASTVQTLNALGNSLGGAK